MGSEAGAARVLVVDDETSLVQIMCDELRTRGHEPSSAHDVAGGLDLLKHAEFEVALLDLDLPDGSGLDIVRRIADEELPTEAIVLTGKASLPTAIEAMKLGAYDYLAKPAHMEELDALVRKAAEKARLRRDNASLRARLERHQKFEGLVSGDPALQELMRTLERVAPSDLPVLIQGETGTGKELFARAVHRMSPRASRAFVAINCGAVPETLLESELFGHEKGAFTGALSRKLGLFEVAEGGVLFLDEIGEIAPSAQVKLLRTLESKEFLRLGATRATRCDVRIVSASNRDLKVEMEQGRFRQDLYYRLNGITLRLPPLRSRVGDIPLLAEHFVGRAGRKLGLSAAALQALQAYRWPGNVRELQMVIQRAAILAPGATIEVAHLPADLTSPGRAGGGDARTTRTLAEVEWEHIQAVLKANGGNRGKTAQALGIDVKTLYNKLKANNRDGSAPSA